MKRNNKKGFTIVELVIVIAVIAILAGVLIPTFAGVIGKAQDSAALQEATGIKNIVNAEILSTEKIDITTKAESKTIRIRTSGNKWFTYADGKLTAATAVPTDLEVDSGDYVYANSTTLPSGTISLADGVSVSAVSDLNAGAILWID